MQWSIAQHCPSCLFCWPALHPARTARQWATAGQLRLVAALLVAACEAALFTRPLLLLMMAVAGATALIMAVAILPDDETGHRAGAEGFGGACTYAPLAVGLERCQSPLLYIAAGQERFP